MVAICWDMTPCNLVCIQQYGAGTFSFHIHGNKLIGEHRSSPTAPRLEVLLWKVPYVKCHDYCHSWRAERRRTWTCGGVPRTYKAASAISSGFRCGCFSSHTSEIISVHTSPGLRLCKFKYWDFYIKFMLINTVTIIQDDLKEASRYH
jgi:hypothetical protein